MLKRTREEGDNDEKDEKDDQAMVVTAKNISAELSQYEISIRKVLWIILKSVFDINNKKIVTSWLQNFANQHVAYYASLEILFGTYYTEEFLAKAIELLAPIDSDITLCSAQKKKLLELEKGIYKLFEENIGLYTALQKEVDEQDSKLIKLMMDFQDYLLSLEASNYLMIENYFLSLEVDVKETLWEALRSPFDTNNQPTAYNWINEGSGKDFYNDVMRIDAQLKELIKGKIDEYREGLKATAKMSLVDPDEKLFYFFAHNIPVFDFIMSELDNENSVMLRILREYKKFLNIPIDKPSMTLRAKYDKTHPLKPSKEDKDTAILRNLGFFANLSGKSNVINVHSIGFENCLLHSTYYSSYRAKAKTTLIDCNKEFFNHLTNSIKQDAPNTVIFINGSLRQSYPADEFCWILPTEYGAFSRSESIFTALPMVTNHVSALTNVPCKMDGYLLVDTFSDLQEGSIFVDAVRKLTNNNYESKSLEGKCVNDKSKVILLYAQMHKIASQYKNKTIKFDFYSGDLKELQQLYIFFINHKELKPHTLYLNFYFYQPKSLEFGKFVELKYHIDNSNCGPVDFDYKANVKIMSECCDLPCKSEIMAATTDDKSVSKVPSLALASRNTDMPATKTIDASVSFNLLAFKQKRVFTETIKMSEPDTMSLWTQPSILR